MPVKAFAFEVLDDLRLHSDGVQDSISGHVSWPPVIVLSSISIFLLLLASFNFININLAMAGARLKEIGIRKVIGGNKRQLAIQFLTENALVCLASFIMAIALTGSLLLPGFESIAGTGLTRDFADRPDLWLYLVLLLVAVGLMSANCIPHCIFLLFNPSPFYGISSGSDKRISSCKRCLVFSFSWRS